MAEKGKLPLVYKDSEGNIVYREGSTERNDDWIKELERRNGNPERMAYEEVKALIRARSKGSRDPSTIYHV